jgi:hypothetical protein
MMRRISTLLGVCALLSACSSGGGELKVSSVEPNVGTVNGSENVMLLGGGFQPGKTSCTVRFGAKEAANVTIVSDSKIQVTTPANDPGPVDVLVTFDDGRTFKLGGGFNFKVPDQSKARDIFLSGGKVTVPGPSPQKK